VSENKGQHELEQAVLACMVSSPRVAPKVAAILRCDDFVDRTHQTIYDVMQDMLDDGQRVDELTLSAELRSFGATERVVDTATALYGIAAQLASVDLAEEYAQAIREEAIRRDLTGGVDHALRVRGGVEEIVAAVETAVFDARSRLHSTEGMKALTSTSILSPLDAILSASESAGGYPYPFPSMRDEYGPWEKGRLAYLGGYSGDGKSTVMFQWIEEMCEAGAKVGVYQLEMTPAQVARTLALQGGCITQKQAKGIDELTIDDQARYEERRKQIAAWNLTVKCGPTTPQQIRADQARERFDVIAVDHLHKFERTSAGEYVDLTRYSGQLHRITRDLDCSVVCLVQFKKPQRDRDGRTRKLEPTIADLRGSGSMEEDADDVLLVYQTRDSVDRRTGYGSLLIAKMRDGAPDKSVPIKFEPRVLRFYEYDPNHASGPSVLARREGSAA
jgi:replicative DNA helicase